MTGWQLIAAAGLYLWTCYDLVAVGKTGLAFAYLCYALSNFGFVWAAHQ